MSKKVTPCEKLGYKVGDKFTVIKDSYFEKGTIVALSEDDGSEVPWFTCGGVRRALIIGSNPDVEPTPSKLKPAKQALADAIHQSGGWMHGAEYAAQDKCAQVTMFRSKPIRHGNTWLDDEGFDDVGGFGCDKIQNWHQCVLSRGEYFIAYPEQPKDEVMSKDWHKNGELPPVGEVCVFEPGDGAESYNNYELEAVGSEVVVIAHTKFNRAVGYVAVFKFDCERGCGVTTGCASVFRPLRTEREKAIDEMVCEFIDHHGDPKGGERYLGIAAKLYDAGYRKEVK